MNVSNMNVSNTTGNGGLQSDKQNYDGPGSTSVILSVVMPIICLLFCIAYVFYDMEKSTRPEKDDKHNKKQRKQSRLKSANTLVWDIENNRKSPGPVKTPKIQPKADIESKETPNPNPTEELEVKEDTIDKSFVTEADVACKTPNESKHESDIGESDTNTRTSGDKLSPNG